MKKKIKLDLKDKKILYLLTKNARFSSSTISKYVGLSRENVQYRINRLIEKKLIKKFITNIYRRSIGLKEQYDILIKLEKITIEEKKNIIKTLVKQDNIIRVIETEGKWNIGLTVLVKDYYHLDEIVEYIKKLTNKYSVSFDCMITLKDRYFNRNFFTKKNEINIDTKKERGAFNRELLKNLEKRSQEVIRLDDKNLEILRSLRDDSRKELNHIGKIVKLSSNTVKYRIKNMINLGIIKFFTILLDYEKLGYLRYHLYFKLKGSREDNSKLINYLKSLNETYSFYEFVSPWDIMVMVYVNDQKRLKEIISQISGMFFNNIKSYEILWVTKEHKYVPYQDNLKELLNVN